MQILTGHPVFLFGKSDSPTYRNLVRFYEIISLNLGIADVVFPLQDDASYVVVFVGGVGACRGEFEGKETRLEDRRRSSEPCANNRLCEVGQGTSPA